MVNRPTKRRLLRALAAVALLAGCAPGCAATSAEVTRPAQAPDVGPTSHVEMVPTAPEGGVLLGEIDVRRNLLADEGDCEERIRQEAEELGATHAVVRRHHHWSPKAGSRYLGNETYDGCDGAAYLRPTLPDEAGPTSVP